VEAGAVRIAGRKVPGYLPWLLLLAAACASYDQSARIADVRKAETIILENTGRSGNVHAIGIRGSGEIRGEATVTLMLNGKPYKTETLSGPVRFKWGGDWYSNTAEIRYEPGEVSSGELVIEYRFSTL
jgi:hypothetical protein